MRTLKHEDACLSNYALDRWLVGQLSEVELRSTREHVDSCPRCSLRCDELSRQRTAFYGRAPSWDAFEKRRNAATVATTPARRAELMPLMAAAALLVLGVGVGVEFGSSGLQSSATERAKGGAAGEQVRK